MTEQDYTALVAERALAVRFQDIPGDVLEHMAADLLDGLAAILGGTSAPGVPETLAFIRSTSAEGTSQVFGHPDRLPAVFAAQANATAGHALDFDDTLDEGGGMHAGVPIHAVSLALADEIGGVSGEDYLAAVVTGLDLSVRLALATTQDWGWHRAAVFSIFGATVAGGRLLGLDAEQLRNALGIAYSQAAGNRQCIVDGALSKRLQPGFASRDAITALRLAQAGVTGATNVFEGRDGFVNLYQRGAWDKDVLLDDLGAAFISSRVSLKPYPSGRPTHLVIDSALDVFARAGNEGIERIEVATAGAPPEAYPTQVVRAQFNYPFLASLALATGGVSIEHVGRPDAAPAAVKALYERATQVPVTPGEHAGVVVTYGDGRVERSSAEFASGHPSRPLTEAQLRAKVADCNRVSSHPLEDGALDRVIEAALGVARLADVRDLTAALSAGAGVAR